MGSSSDRCTAGAKSRTARHAERGAAPDTTTGAGRRAASRCPLRDPAERVSAGTSCETSHHEAGPRASARPRACRVPRASAAAPHGRWDLRQQRPGAPRRLREAARQSASPDARIESDEDFLAQPRVLSPVACRDRTRASSQNGRERGGGGGAGGGVVALSYLRVPAGPRSARARPASRSDRPQPTRAM